MCCDLKRADAIVSEAIFRKRFKGGRRDPMSHRGEGAIYKDSLAKPSPQEMSGPPLEKPKESARTAQDSAEGREEMLEEQRLDTTCPRT